MYALGGILFLHLIIIVRFILVYVFIFCFLCQKFTKAKRKQYFVDKCLLYYVILFIF